MKVQRLEKPNGQKSIQLGLLIHDLSEKGLWPKTFIFHNYSSLNSSAKKRLEAGVISVHLLNGVPQLWTLVDSF